MEAEMRGHGTVPGGDRLVRVHRRGLRSGVDLEQTAQRVENATHNADRREGVGDDHGQAVLVVGHQAAGDGEARHSSWVLTPTARVGFFIAGPHTSPVGRDSSSRVSPTRLHNERAHRMSVIKQLIMQSVEQLLHARNAHETLQSPKMHIVN
jgi:hypothetical protein